MRANDLATHYSSEELERRYRQAQRPVERSRWQILWLKSRGKRITEIIDATGYKRWSISTLIRQYNLHGEAGVRDLRQDNGSQPALEATQQQQLLAALSLPPPGGGFWSGPQVKRHVQQHFGAEITQVCAWSYFNRLGYSVQIPRPTHIRAATPDQQDTFKKSASYGADGPTR